MSVASQWLGKQIPAAMKEQLQAMFSLQSV
jgi:hypothetical protein